MDIQRIRTLTTRRLHTDIGHVYQDIEYLTGERGIMTHNIPGALQALEPWLRQALPDTRFWDGKHDPLHTGDVDLKPMTELEREAFFVRLTS